MPLEGYTIQYQPLLCAGKVSATPLSDTYNLDVFTWMTLRTIAQDQPNYLTKLLHIECDTVKLLASCSDNKIRAVASGVICSFRLSFDESRFIRTLLTMGRFLKEAPSTLSKVDAQLPTAVSDLFCDYLRYVRDCVRSEGLAIARVRYDQSENVLRALENASDQQIRVVSRTINPQFEMRFSSECLHEILQREHVTHFKVTQFQEAIASLSSAYIAIGNSGGTAQIHQTWFSMGIKGSRAIGPSDAECAPTLRGHHPQWQLATQLGRLGFNGQTICTETGITPSQLTRLRNELREQGISVKNIPKRPVSGRFIESYQTSIHASILMQLYHELAGPDCQYRIDMNALVGALRLYQSIRIESGSDNVFRWPEITSVEAYVLAKECRGDGIQIEAYMDECSECEAKYFVSIHQNVSDAFRCPYCRLRDAVRLNAA